MAKPPLPAPFCETTSVVTPILRARSQRAPNADIENTKSTPKEFLLWLRSPTSGGAKRAVIEILPTERWPKECAKKPKTNPFLRYSFCELCAFLWPVLCSGKTDHSPSPRLAAAGCGKTSIILHGYRAATTERKRFRAPQGGTPSASPYPQANNLQTLRFLRETNGICAGITNC